MLPHLPPDQQKELLVHMNQNKLEPIADYMELGRVMGERTLLLIQYREAIICSCLIEEKYTVNNLRMYMSEPNYRNEGQLQYIMQALFRVCERRKLSHIYHRCTKEEMSIWLKKGWLNY